jgi:nucleotide-binding universal stress UspA family protein
MPTQIRKILVAFDGSKDALKAVEMACSLAKNYASSIVIAYVYSLEVYAYGGAAPIPVPDFQPLEEAARAKGKTILDKGVQKAKDEGIESTSQLIEAPSIVQALLEFAEKENVDLIVVGTRGVSGFKKLIMGSVSSGLTSHAECPVLVVR